MKPYINFLPLDHLQKLNTQRLLGVLAAARRAAGKCNNETFCESCYDHHPMNTPEAQADHDKRLKEYQEYFDLIKSLLAQREHVVR